MKRIVCLLLVVSIAYAGCEVREYSSSILDDLPSKETGVSHMLPGTTVEHIVSIQDVVVNITELQRSIKKLESELNGSKITPKKYEVLLARIVALEAEIELQRAEEKAEKALLVRIVALEAELESQRAEEKAEKALLVRIAELEAEIELQRVEIVSSTNAYCLYEVAMESQRVTIESLEKLCRMYEAEIESQGKSRSNEESPPGKEPEAGKNQGHE